MTTKIKRPSWDEFCMQFADSAKTRSSCIRRQIGAVLVDPMSRAVLSIGYNGTPSRTKNCDEGGCPRCADDTIQSGEGEHLCMCVHAEQNAIALAARYGVRTNQLLLYVTNRPCLSCLRLIVQAGIREVIYRDAYPVPASYELAGESTYLNFASQLSVNLRRYRIKEQL